MPLQYADGEYKLDCTGRIDKKRQDLEVSLSPAARQQRQGAAAAAKYGFRGKSRHAKHGGKFLGKSAQGKVVAARHDSSGSCNSSGKAAAAIDGKKMV
jgi:hypothetical protein